MLKVVLLLPLLLNTVDASVVLRKPEPSNIIAKNSIDPPTNPLHSIKLTEFERQFESSEDRRASEAKWDGHDPGYYTDDFARNFMLPLAAAGYSDDPSTCLKNKFKNGTLSKHVVTTCESDNKKYFCAGFTALEHAEKAIMISFRGTEGFLELVTEADHVILKRKKASPIGGKVAYYFDTVFKQLWNAGMEKDVKRLLAEYPDYELWITGHSLGGAVASISAAWMMNQYNFENDRIKLITFGQPRTGDSRYALAHNLKLPRTYRVTHKRDLVPHLPPEKFEDYFHHVSEIWYPDTMKPGDKFIVCNGGESNECSDKQWVDTSVYDHYHYFEKYVSDYGLSECADN